MNPPATKHPRPDNFPESVALYGGSFDPVHLGHLAVARAAARHFQLTRVYFVPAGAQPLKTKRQATHFYHRYAMLALALAGEERFVPSLLEAPEILRAAGQAASYTVDTVERMRARMRAGTKLYFLIGIDAFEHVAQWRSAVELLRSTEFIVASRPGYSLRDAARALPEELRPDDKVARQWLESGTLQSGGATIHLLPEVHEMVSATSIRQAARHRAGLEKLVPAAVADYITKLRIYDGEAEPGAPEPPRL